MIRSDYILRLIEELGTFLRSVIGAALQTTIDTPVDSKALELADAAIGQTAIRGLGLTFETLEAMQPDEIASLFCSDRAARLDRCFLAALLYDYDARLSYRKLDRVKSRRSAQRALYLYAQFNTRAEATHDEDYEIDAKVADLYRFIGHALSP